MPRFPALTLLLLVGCQKSVEPATPPRATNDAPPTASPPPAASLPPAPAPAPAPKPELASTPESEPASRAARIRSGSSTRGVIQCGDASCEAGKQRCVGTSEWQCVAAALQSDAEISYACDDGTDCPNGETCCLGFESALEAYVCSKRSGPETNCRLEICAEGGAPCPKGQVCEEGACTAPNRAATCEGKRCPSERPLCAYSERGSVCSTWDELQAVQSEVQTAALRCTRRSDCGPGASCCTNALWNATQCSTNCDSGNEGEVCTRDADCTRWAGRSGKCRSARDGDIASLPAWLKVCAYD